LVQVCIYGQASLSSLWSVWDKVTHSFILHLRVTVKR